MGVTVTDADADGTPVQERRGAAGNRDPRLPARSGTDLDFTPAHGATQCLCHCFLGRKPPREPLLRTAAPAAFRCLRGRKDSRHEPLAPDRSGDPSDLDDVDADAVDHTGCPIFSWITVAICPTILSSLP